MGLFSFFKKKDKKEENGIDLSHIKCDIHAHLLPGIDDGSQNMEDSIAMIIRLKELGYQKLLCTPHVMDGYYQNETKDIVALYETLKNELKARNVDIQIDVAAEYNFDKEFLKRIESDDLLTFGNDDYQYLLFELSYFNEPMGISDVVTKIKEKGYIPVLAHPERYPYFAETTSKYKVLKDQGVLFQLNINSLNGLYPGTAKITAKWLIEQEMINFIGTDAHRIEHVNLLDDTFKFTDLHTLVNSGQLMNPYV